MMITTIMSRLAITALTGITLLGGGAAFASTSSTQAGGRVRLFVGPGTSAASPILLTGAIGDFGTTTSVNKNGKKDPEGTYIKVTLRKGTFRVNATALDGRLNKAQPALDQATCSGWLVQTGPVWLANGTGRYAGISGTLQMTVTLAFISPRYTSGKDKGQCEYNTQPLSRYASTTGSGIVKYK
jgi:hypothetical protein